MVHKLENIKLLLLDVDGVLTDGSLYFDNNWMESKAFNARDGFGITLLMTAGIKVGLVTGRKSLLVAKRAQSLGIDLVYQGVHDKGVVVESIIEEHGLNRDQVGFVGDDLIDIPAMNACGHKFTVSDAPHYIRSVADYVTDAKGGQGAVREICDYILRQANLWESVTDPFFSGRSEIIPKQ